MFEQCENEYRKLCGASKSCFENKSLETNTAREAQNGRFNNETMATNLCFLAMVTDCMEEKNFLLCEITVVSKLSGF